MRLDRGREGRGLELPSGPGWAQHPQGGIATGSRSCHIKSRDVESELRGQDLRAISLSHPILQMRNRTDGSGDLTRVTQQVRSRVWTPDPWPLKLHLRKQEWHTFLLEILPGAFCSPPSSPRLISSTRIYSCWTNVLQRK